MSLLGDYIAGWRRQDVDAVLATLADACVVTECYGPVYRGKDRVAQWMASWFGAGGRVIDWRITSTEQLGDVEIAEWVFTCIWNGADARLDGATIARLSEGRIVYLREYVTTAPLYDWSGVWRS